MGSLETKFTNLAGTNDKALGFIVGLKPVLALGPGTKTTPTVTPGTGFTNADAGAGYVEKFELFHVTKKTLGSQRGYIALVVLWIGFEWLHSNWELAHPWNTLGNAFANYPTLIQWYEYTGVLGGSCWILITNVLLFILFKRIFLSKELPKTQLRLIGVIAVVMVVPSFCSAIVYANYLEDENPIEVVVVQPNIDPYYDKFNNMTEAEQIERIIALAKTQISPQTQFVVAPETALPRGSDEADFENNYGIIAIRNLIKEFPNIQFVTGIATRITYDVSTTKPTPTARRNHDAAKWHDSFNTAILVDASATIQTYHKSKLVLGVEKMPYPKLLAPLENLALNLGGTFGSLGQEKEAKIFTSQKTTTAPIICYESVFAEYTSSYVKKGANLLFIITNDGWWKDTPGYQQHLAFARLRAIENRRSIARSANTGISCFINQRGDVLKPTDWWQPAAIKTRLNTNSNKTFYTQHGDVIGRLSAAISILLLLASVVLKLKTRRTNFGR